MSNHKCYPTIAVIRDREVENRIEKIVYTGCLLNIESIYSYKLYVFICRNGVYRFWTVQSMEEPDL